MERTRPGFEDLDWKEVVQHTLLFNLTFTTGHVFY
jgi:hypothetical protein